MTARVTSPRRGLLHALATPVFVGLLTTLSFVYVAAEIWQDLANQHDDHQRELRITSQAAATGAEHFLRSWERVFASLQESPCVRTKSPAECRQFFSALKQRYPELVNVAAIDRFGDFYASALPLPAKKSAREFDFFTEVAGGRQRHVVGPMIGPISGQPVGALLSRITDARGHFDGALSISFHFEDLLRASQLGLNDDGQGLAILDRDGRVIDGGALSRHWIGQVLLAPGSGDVFSRDGINYHAHLTPLEGTPWGFVAYTAVPGTAEVLFKGAYGEFYLTIPLAVLSILAAVVAARSRRSELALASSEQALREALGRTEQAVAERTRELAGSELLYRTLFEQAPGGIVLLDEAGNILDFNANATRLTGYADDELFGMNVSRLDATMTADDVRAFVETVLRDGGAQLQARARRKDGSIYPILLNARPVQVPGNPAARLLTFWSDLSELSREQALRTQLQNRLQAVVENTHDGVVLTDAEGCIIYANPALGSIVGWPPDTLIGQPITLLVPVSACPAHNMGLAAAVRAGFELPANRTIERHCLHKSGREVPVDLTISSWTEAGETYFSAIMRDLSEQKRAQERLRFTQKMEAVGILAGGIAHDFNNLLAIMMGHAQLAHDAAPEGSPIRGYAEKINKAVLRARAIIKQLLDFSRHTDEVPRAMSLAAELGEIETLLQVSHPRHIKLRFSIEGVPSAIYAVPHQVHQVIINLINNACDAIGDAQGEVDISLNEETRSDAASLLVGAIQPGRYAVLRIRDTGSGIGEELLDQIFIPFFTTKEVGRGTGLGLAVVRGIMEDLGGAIAVSNRPTGGTCFELFFPVIPSSPADDSPPQEPSRGHGETILMVDDEPEVIEAYVEYLAKVGFKPLLASSGEAALQILAQRRGEIRALVSDLLMPQMDGITLAARMAREFPGIPVLLLTGRGEIVQSNDIFALGIAGLIAKPAEPQIIASELRRVIDQFAQFGQSVATST